MINPLIPAIIGKILAGIKSEVTVFMPVSLPYVANYAFALLKAV